MNEYILFFLISIIAFLYSSVGHAGASGYIAVMSLFGVSLSIIKPTSLLLNILVATVTSVQFIRAKYFSLKLFLPFALTSIPFAFLGGYIKIPTKEIKLVIGLLLFYSAFTLVFRFKEKKKIQEPNLFIQLLTGSIIGFFSGITGTGGGIFLTPIILLFGWANIRTTAGVSALFILFNSIAGLVGFYLSNDKFEVLWFLSFPVLLFGFIGSYMGANHYKPKLIYILLGLVLMIASAKLIFNL